ncbi:MAG: MBL fold metallo-hydrolase [Chlorobi bacterium]|nr:MBL fold metallo-hydrolase [Chlorobiota bacterium]
MKSGSAGILIDAGSEVLTEHLDEAGVEKIEWVLHTHYHRDQCTGDLKLKKSGSKVAIGESEADFLQPAEDKAPFRIPDNFLLNGEFPGWGRRMAPFLKPGVDRKFAEGEIFHWKQYAIKVINTPGHTKGSVSYVVDVDGQRICFSGDLIMSGGHIRDLYSMQWIYLGNPGIDSSILSLNRIKTLSIDKLLPSHGEIIPDPCNEIEMLTIRLKKFQESFNSKRSGRWNWSGFVQVSPHVIQDCGTTSQIIISNTGEALLFDCGKEMTTERLAEAKRKFGIKKVSVIIPSHWHYDHVDGIPAMAEAEGADIWVWEGLAEHLEHPGRFGTTCWTGKSIKPDRILSVGEEFQWEGYSFKVFHHPVHMEEQIGLRAKVDGISFYMIADGTYLSKDGKVRCSIHCYNGISLSSGLLKTAQSFYDADPYICLPAHSNCFATHQDDKNEFLNWAIETTDIITALLSPPHPELGFNPYWVTFYPARVYAKPGDEVQISLRIKNPGKRMVYGMFRPKNYGNLAIQEKSVEYTLQPGEQRDFPLKIKVERSAQTGVHIITADVQFDGEVYAELPQGYIQVN